MAAPARIVEVVVDNTTSGAGEARATHDMLAEAGIAYADAPVSGGASGARAGTLAMMVATSDALYTRLEPLLLPMAKNARHVGREPGQGMAMKLLNNFLSGMAMAATSEAIAFGARQGLDMATIIDTVSVSSGTNTAITDKFPKRILSESFDSGFATRLMTKDLQLYVDSCKQLDAPRRLSETLLEQVWGQMLVDMPASDFTEIYPFTLTRDK
ncbi:MAG: NAD(P)-dependent oxidoreductase [Rhodospirillaceae bacterium]|nr:NAD(P)-dependent oxidoreductase [Rhodospirillaceae bacterium]